LVGERVKGKLTVQIRPHNHIKLVLPNGEEITIRYLRHVGSSTTVVVEADKGVKIRRIKEEFVDVNPPINRY